MSRPATTPEWASNLGAADIVEPTSGKKAKGWKKRERLVAQYLNWLFYWIYKWLLYIDDSGAKTMTVNAFTGGVVDANWARTRVTGLPGWVESTAGGIYSVSPGAFPTNGYILTTVQYQSWGNGVADFTVNVYRMDGTATGPNPSPDTATITNETASWHSRSMTLATPSALGTSDTYIVEFVANAAGIRINNVRFIYTHAGILP